MSQPVYKKIERRELRRLYVSLRRMGYKHETARIIALLELYGEVDDW